MSFSLLYYAIDARKWFKGPRVNIEHLIHGENALAQSSSGDSGSDQMGREIEREKVVGKME